MQTPVDIFLGDGNNQAQVGFDQILLGPLGFLLAVPDNRKSMTKIVDGRSRGGFPLADFPAQLAQTSLRIGTAPSLDLFHLPLEVIQLLDSPVDLLAELLPLQMNEWNATNGLRGLHLGPAEFGGQPLPGLL